MAFRVGQSNFISKKKEKVKNKTFVRQKNFLSMKVKYLVAQGSGHGTKPAFTGFLIK